MDNIELDIAKMEFQLTQEQMNKYDGISTTTKGWLITIWGVLVGWSFQSHDNKYLILSILAALFFWILEAVNKNYREDYKQRRNIVAQALQKIARAEQWPEEFITPDLPSHHGQRAFKMFFQPHIFIVYLSLILVSLFIFIF